MAKPDTKRSLQHQALNSIPFPNMEGLKSTYWLQLPPARQLLQFTYTDLQVAYLKRRIYPPPKKIGESKFWTNPQTQDISGF
ncbi:MAG: hypothetical protein ACHQT7_01450 [Candidatus Levyibacteriota bacterium]